MSRLSVHSGDEGLKLVRTWRSKQALWAALLAGAALLIWVGAFGSAPPRDAGLVAIAGRVVIGLLAIFALYWTLTSLFNRSVVTVVGQSISAAHGPLPVPGVSNLKAAPVREVKVRFVRQARTDGPTYYRYELVAHLTDGLQVVLFSDHDMALTERAQAEIMTYLTAK